MTRRIPLLFTLLALAAGVLSAAGAPAAEERGEEAVFQSQAFTVDGIYRSMQGPSARQVLRLGNPVAPEIFWITGYHAEIVDGETHEVLSPEFMCHSNLGVSDMEALGKKRPGHERLFTLAQGQMGVDFPEGFAIPILSTEFLNLDSQILNLNPQSEVFSVRHRVTIKYVRDHDLTKPKIPLFEKAAQALVMLEGDSPYFGVEDPDPKEHGPGCMVGQAVPGSPVTIKAHQVHDSSGQVFTTHWAVPPGRQVNRSLVTESLALPFDTTIHYISVHLHPFAESLELRDRTTDESLFLAYAHPSKDHVGLDSIDSYSSAEGIPVYKDHEYEMISIYDNPTQEDQDAMAVMFLYMRDYSYKKPKGLDGP